MLDFYTKSNCPACARLKKQLDAWGVGYAEVNVDGNTIARAFLVEWGHKSLPVLYNGKDNIPVDGLTEEKIRQIIGGG